MTPRLDITDFQNQHDRMIVDGNPGNVLIQNNQKYGVWNWTKNNVKRTLTCWLLPFVRWGGDIDVLRGLFSYALGDTRWGTYSKYGITEEALKVVRANRDVGKENWFSGTQAAHDVSKKKYCHRPLTENMDNPYQYMRSVDRCIQATTAENRGNGWDHLSKVYSLNPDLFREDTSTVVKKRHPDYPAFLALVAGDGIDLGKDEPGMTLQRLEDRKWVDVIVDGQVVNSPVKIDKLPAGRYRLIG